MRAAAFLTTLFTVLTDRVEARSEKGATAVEYGLLVGLIAVAIIAVVALLGPELTRIFQSVVDGLGKVDTTTGD